jgi:hypothetical protein
MYAAIPPLPNMPTWHGAQLKYRDNFTFYSARVFTGHWWVNRHHFYCTNVYICAWHKYNAKWRICKSPFKARPDKDLISFKYHIFRIIIWNYLSLWVFIWMNHFLSLALKSGTASCKCMLGCIIHQQKHSWQGCGT